MASTVKNASFLFWLNLVLSVFVCGHVIAFFIFISEVNYTHTVLWVTWPIICIVQKLRYSTGGNYIISNGERIMYQFKKNLTCEQGFRTNHLELRDQVYMVIHQCIRDSMLWFDLMNIVIQQSMSDFSFHTIGHLKCNNWWW